MANFIPSVLSSVGLGPTLDLQQQYQQFIPLLLERVAHGGNPQDRARPLFQKVTMDNSSLSFNPDTLSKFEHWQQHLSTDVDSTLNELMRLASQSHQLQQTNNRLLTEVGLKVKGEGEKEYIDNLSPFTLNLSPLQDRSLSDLGKSSNEPNPWLAISRLTETVANLTAKVLEQNDHLMALQSNTPNPQPVKSSPSPKSEPTNEDKDSTSPNLESLSSDELRNTRAPGAPTEKLNRALHAIIQYNQQQSEPSKMWRINPQVLQQLTGSFQANVKSFFQQHQQAIDLHNQQFHLTTVRHNASHNGQHPSEVIHW